MIKINKRISLIIPTYGRYHELAELLLSLEKQDCNKNDFEVIIVDQNDVIDLAPIVNRYLDKLAIIHLKTLEKGIAKAKNTGLEIATASIVAFPDDDCTYYPDTISTALNYMDVHQHADVVYGRLFDRAANINIMRNWPNKVKTVNVFNFHYTYSPVTVFIRRNNIRFDVNFGVGSAYGVGEELDYLLQTFKRKLVSLYTPTIDIWHPRLDPNIMNPEKVYYYAKGYGAICRKHFSAVILLTFLMSNTYQIMQIMKSLLLFDKLLAYKRWLALKGRIVGFSTFNL